MGSKTAEHLSHQWHIEDVRAIRDSGRTLGQQTRRHQFEHAVLGAPDSDFPTQPIATGHQETLTHGDSLEEPSPRSEADGYQSARYVLGMGVHLTRIYTRTGDDGTSGLSDFSRVPKDDPRLIAYADCDEANATIGVALALGRPDEGLQKVLAQIQNDLFDAGADLSTPVVENPEHPPLRITQTYIDRLEAWCDEYNSKLPALTSFILPGGTGLSALLHVARTVTRRAERSAWIAVKAYPDTVSPSPAKYLNRLSDLLFILSRTANPGGDVLWQPGGAKGDDTQS